MHLSLLDITLIFIYFLVTFIIARFSNKPNNNIISNSRKLSLPMFVATIVATWYGGILGVGEFAYKFGFLHILTNGIPYYFFAIIFAIFFAKQIHGRSTSFNLADDLKDKYDNKIAHYISFYILILTIPVPYFLMLSQLFTMIFGVSYSMSLIISFVVITIILWNGNFDTISHNNIFDFILMLASFIMLYLFSSYYHGSIFVIIEKIPAELSQINGGQNMAYILSWFVIAMWTLVDPTIYQMTKSAQNSKTARNGLFIAVIFWFIFDCLTLSCALYAKYLFPNLEQPVLTYPYLALSVLPQGCIGLFFAGLFAIIISTLLHNCYISCVTFSNNIWPQIFKNSNLSFRNKFRISLILNLLFAIFVLIFIPSVYELWYIFGAVLIPALLIPTINCYYPKILPIKYNEILNILKIVPLSTLVFYFINNKFSLINLEPVFFGFMLCAVIKIYGYLQNIVKEPASDI